MGNSDKTLDSLLEGQKDEPHATFHDASLTSVSVDYVKRFFSADFDLCVGDPDDPGMENRERRRKGRVSIEGLIFWVIDAPDGKGNPCPWMTSDGPLSEARTETARSLAKKAPEGSVSWYLYFADSNSFAYVAGMKASFKWL